MQYVLRFGAFSLFHLFSLKTPKMVPRLLQEPQKGPKRVPRWSPKAPTRPQDDTNGGPRRRYDCPRRPPSHPRASKRTQDAPKTLQDTPQTPKVHHWKAASVTHGGPKEPREAQKGSAEWRKPLNPAAAAGRYDQGSPQCRIPLGLSCRIRQRRAFTGLRHSADP